VLCALGICRVQLNSIQTAIGLLNEALTLAERSGMPCDSLRSDILSWRSRCWRHQRDYEAAREDIERALQLAEDANDPRTIGAAYFQASVVADREGHWVLARTYAETPTRCSPTRCTSVS
jgi:tetratricopeptide (TPR) repeat protein